MKKIVYGKDWSLEQILQDLKERRVEELLRVGFVDDVTVVEVE